jgi:hypothetical protein
MVLIGKDKVQGQVCDLRADFPKVGFFCTACRDLTSYIQYAILKILNQVLVHIVTNIER